MANLNSGKPWSALDLADLRNGIDLGVPLVKIADFLCRDVDEVRTKVAQQQKGRTQPEG